MHFENDIGTSESNISYIMGFLYIEFKVLQKSNKWINIQYLPLDQDSIWLPQMFHHKVSLIYNHNSSGKLFKSSHHNHELLEIT